MRDTSQRIIDAAIDIFIENGYQATTQDIAKQAKVAEVTLFRKFKNKQNLFLVAIQSKIETMFQSEAILRENEAELGDVLVDLFMTRMITLKQNQPVIKMLLAESLKGHLPSHINFPVLFFNQMTDQLAPLNDYVDVKAMVRGWMGHFMTAIVLDLETETEAIRHVLIQPFLKGNSYKRKDGRNAT